jgi:hypothetical protein
LLPQKRFPNVDYICFTDQPFKSSIWDIRKVEPVFKDSTRNSRRIKVNPHKFLPEYDISIYIDGNYTVEKDVMPLLELELGDNNMLAFDHNKARDPRNCVYEEYNALMSLGKVRGAFKDDPEVMKAQMDRYKSEGYPKDNGLIFAAVLIRRHNHPEVVKAMEAWWAEIENGSKRDQLSFNYIAWKNNFSFKTLSGDLRNSEYFNWIGRHRKSYFWKYFRYRLKKMVGMKV